MVAMTRSAILSRKSVCRLAFPPSGLFPLVRVYEKLNRKEDLNRALAKLTRPEAQASKPKSNRE